MSAPSIKLSRYPFHLDLQKTALCRKSAITFQPDNTMSSDSTSSSLPDKGDTASAAESKPRDHTGVIQQGKVDAPNSHSSNSRTGSQPASPQDENGTEDTLPQPEQQRADLIKGMKFVADLMKKLGIASVAMSLHRGHQFEILKQYPRAVRTYESTQVNGAWILGDVNDNMTDLTYAKRLHHLGLLGGESIRKQSLAFHHGDFTNGRTSAQPSQVSNMHINIPSAPGVVILAPPHDPGEVFRGFRDALTYNIQVSIIV